MRGRLLGLKHRGGRVVNGRNRRLEKMVRLDYAGPVVHHKRSTICGPPYAGPVGPPQWLSS